MRAKGYKCSNVKCNSCVEHCMCGELGDAALNCVDRIITRQTNADRIRSMSDEELASFMDRCEMSDIDYAKTFCDLCNGQYECDQCRLDWLKQPAE